MSRRVGARFSQHTRRWCHTRYQCWEAVYGDPDEDSALRFKASSD